MLKISKNVVIYSFAVLLVMLSSASFAIEPVGSDSRIRTLIYGKNDVFKISVSTGYQTVIEFEQGEKIKTISMGNSGFFKITPQKNRLFIRALQNGQLTNITVLTDRRTYQIEISSETEDESELMYVVRFYYPDSQYEELNSALGGLREGASGNIGVNDVSGAIEKSMLQSQYLNYNYSLTGPQNLSPLEVFDDGQNVYMKFNTQIMPDFRKVAFSGKEVPTNFYTQDGYYVIQGVSPIITVYFGNQHICIYNESMSVSMNPNTSMQMGGYVR